MFCTECGGTLLASAKFCANCGNKTATQPIIRNEISIPSESYDAVRETTDDQLAVVRPWVRYWARMIDGFLFGIVVVVLVEFLDEAYPGILTDALDPAWGFLALGAWVFVEPLWLCTMGATPGKWLLRTVVRTGAGENPGYALAINRSASVWWRGLAAGIPLINIATMIRGYKRLTAHGETSWDEDWAISVIHYRIGYFRALIAAFVLLALLMVAIALPWAFHGSLLARLDGIPTVPTTAIVDPWKEYAVQQQPTTAPADQSGADNSGAERAGPNWDELQPSKVDLSAETARWNVDALAFENAHPALTYGENGKIVQEKLNELGSLPISNTEMLNRAYAAALRDSRWYNGP